ncbi:sigma factor, partial [Microbacterium aurantiacum]|uniref:sigma factor n=1 Tax=Microbacterium aurantiacum TaxID=162393 RepID=UPI003422F105
MIAEVIREAAPALLGFFVRRVDAAADAADLVSYTCEAAVRAAERMPEDRHEARLWLFGIARNVLRPDSCHLSADSAVVGRSALIFRGSGSAGYALT